MMGWEDKGIGWDVRGTTVGAAAPLARLLNLADGAASLDVLGKVLPSVPSLDAIRRRPPRCGVGHVLRRYTRWRRRRLLVNVHLMLMHMRSAVMMMMMTTVIMFVFIIAEAIYFGSGEASSLVGVGEALKKDSRGGERAQSGREEA